MITVKATFKNSYTITTRINATFEEAKEYYLNNVFNIGSVEDNMQICIGLKLI